MSLIPGIEAAFAQKIMEVFVGIPPGTEIILFGSRAKGTFREGSDIDLALKGKDITLEWRDRLFAKYEEQDLPWKLDLVLYSLISEPALREHIDRVGRKLR